MRDNRTHVSTQTAQSNVASLPIVKNLNIKDSGPDDAFVASIRRMYTNVFVGFSAFLSPSAVELVLEDPDVLLVEYDSVVSTRIDQTDPIWNLDRIDQSSTVLNGRYYTGSLSGKGVHLYILDTGIASDHQEFEGRIGNGKSFVQNDPSWEDCNGHGTHCASTAVGVRWGVAKEAIVHGVRVLNCGGSGAWSSIIGGLDWVIGESNKWPWTSIASLSLGGDVSSVLNRAVRSAVNQGIFVTVAAGNENKDACTTSPASEPLAVTVGSTSKGDIRSSFSNFGKCVDIYAPGSFIKAADYRYPSGSSILSGTSMATPHIAGAAALFIQYQKESANPQSVRSAMISSATKYVPFSSSVFIRTPNDQDGLGDNDDDDDDETTETPSQRCTTLEGKPCVFPFMFLNKRYSQCTSDEDRAGKFWCSTRVDRDGWHVRGEWGYCNPDTCGTRSPTPAPTPSCTVTDGRACMFPFRFRGILYDTCTNENDPDGRYWCSTKTSANNDHLTGNWGYCTRGCARWNTRLSANELENAECTLYHEANRYRVSKGYLALPMDSHLQRVASDRASSLLHDSATMHDTVDMSISQIIRVGIASNDIKLIMSEWVADAQNREHITRSDCRASGVAVAQKTGNPPLIAYVWLCDSGNYIRGPMLTRSSGAQWTSCTIPDCHTMKDRKKCLFPFEHNGKLHNSCVPIMGKRWCKTYAGGGNQSKLVLSECDLYTCNLSSHIPLNRTQLFVPTDSVVGKTDMLARFADKMVIDDQIVSDMRHHIRGLVIVAATTLMFVVVSIVLICEARLTRTPTIIPVQQ